MSWIVERMLPVLDGVSLVKAARAVGIKTPVLFLRTLAGIHDRVARLDADYLLKPFSCAEVLAPVSALARRPSLAAALPVSRVSPRRCRCVARRRSQKYNIRNDYHADRYGDPDLGCP